MAPVICVAVSHRAWSRVVGRRFIRLKEFLPNAVNLGPGDCVQAAGPKGTFR